MPLDRPKIKEHNRERMGSEKGSSKTVQIIVGVIIVLLVVGGLVFFLIGCSKPETETSAPTTPTPTTVPPSSAAPH